ALPLGGPRRVPARPLPHRHGRPQAARGRLPRGLRHALGARLHLGPRHHGPRELPEAQPLRRALVLRRRPRGRGHRPAADGRPAVTRFLKALRYVLVGAFFGLVLTKSEVVTWHKIRAMFHFREPDLYLIIGSAVAVA